VPADGDADEGHEPASPDAAALEAGIAGGAIFNHYQPKVDLGTGAVVGVEALARWRHPTRGVVAPAGFVPLAEDAGLLAALTRSVVSSALRDARSWAVDGRGLDVAVNVPLDILRGLDFPDRLEELAGGVGFPMERLVLELSESRLPTDARAQLDILSRLRLKGVRLALDDFGTGFSNLAQLRDLPFSELKIDRGFVNGVSGDASRRAIVQAALALARELHVDTVAVGVDASADLDCLRGLGCAMVQGYLVAEPMQASDVAAWLEAWPRRRDGVLAA
jgi:EAL domain-containing protein (putative c-di-GMP-specific phosphodiesterase class I)